MSIEKQIEELKVINQQMAERIKELESQNKREKELNQYKLPRVKQNDMYYSIDDCSEVFDTTENNDLNDNTRYDGYNYFTDENKAKQYADHIKLTLELFQTRDMINDGWKANLNDEFKVKYVIENIKNKVGFYNYVTVYSPFSFETPETRDKFMELVGKDKIIKFLSF